MALRYDETTMKSVVSFVKIIYIKDSRLRLWGSGGGDYLRVKGFFTL